MDIFRYLSYGLSAILVFVGIKMCVEYAAHTFHWVEPGVKVVPWWASLGTIAALLATSIIASIIAARRHVPPPAEPLVHLPEEGEKAKTPVT
jgi:predicted tellurium resistance membrane protein TerC